MRLEFFYDMTWGVAVTLPNHQTKVVEQFVAKSFEYIFPQISKTVRRAGRRVRILEPYLFNYIPVFLSSGWQTIHGMRGVVDLLGPVAERDIDRLKSSIDASGLVTLPKVAKFKVGQRVIPVSGPFVDMTGFYQSTENEQDAALFNLFGSMRTIKFDEGDLVAA